MSHSARLKIERAVRDWRHEFAHDTVAVGLSGGADSLALTAAACTIFTSVTALIVNHNLQRGSADVAATARSQALDLGCDDARVIAVHVGAEGGMEAAARSARYAALDDARGELPVLLAHTLDDQAETVLLGLSRGSGPISIAGMSAWNAPWGRPLLTVRRDDTVAACKQWGIAPHEDPHNSNPAFTRVRLRNEVLPLLEDVLGGGVAHALSRTAQLVRDDLDVISSVADHHLNRIHEEYGTDILWGDPAALPTDPLTGLPVAIRTRLIRMWLSGNGVSGITYRHVKAVDQLLDGHHKGAGVAVPGGNSDARLVVTAEHGSLKLHTWPHHRRS